MNEHLGTPLYMAPQMHDKTKYTSKCDIWSLGVTLHQLLFKCDPYKAKDLDDLKTKIKTTLPNVLTAVNKEGIVSIIKKCLIIEEGKRLSWEELFNMADELRGSKENRSGSHNQSSAFQVGRFNNQNLQACHTKKHPILNY